MNEPSTNAVDPEAVYQIIRSIHSDCAVLIDTRTKHGQRYVVNFDPLIAPDIPPCTCGKWGCVHAALVADEIQRKVMLAW